MLSVLGVLPNTYAPHPLHAEDREYSETNCYADIIIEFLHARGDDPCAALGRTIRTDFEGDQWTFFKPDPRDLETLFGIDIHETQPYRSLPNQIAEQIERGRTLIVELDSWYLPDTQATAYRREHVKSSALIEAIDTASRRLHYFHNRSLYTLDGADYDGALRVNLEGDTEALPPYVELVRPDIGDGLQGEALRAEAVNIFRYHFERRPESNPFMRFSSSLTADLPRLLSLTHGEYHAYAFATTRMAGSAFELCAAHVDWLFGGDAASASASLARIVAGSKAVSFKLARKRPFDAAPLLETLGDAWEETIESLSALLA
jgi:hypothetical protein